MAAQRFVGVTDDLVLRDDDGFTIRDRDGDWTWLVVYRDGARVATMHRIDGNSWRYQRAGSDLWSVSMSFGRAIDRVIGR